MKRVLIFSLVAPPLSFATAFWILLQVANWAAGSPSTFSLGQAASLPTVYLIGLIPALLAATYDYVMEQAEVSWRVGLTAIFAYAVSYLPLVIAGATGTDRTLFLAVRTVRRGARRVVFLAGDGAAAATTAAKPRRLKRGAGPGTAPPRHYRIFAVAPLPHSRARSRLISRPREHATHGALRC